MLGPISRIVRAAGCVDDIHAAAADAHLRFRVRNRDAGEVRRRFQPLRFRALLLAGMLAWLPFSEAGRARADRHLEHRNFGEEAGFPCETLPVNLVVSGLVSECVMLALFALGLALALASRAVNGGLATAVPCAADSLYAGGLLVSSSFGRVRARPGTDHRIRSDDMVFYHADLLSGKPVARRRDDDPCQESDIHAGAFLSRCISGGPKPGLANTAPVLGCIASSVFRRPRLVLQVAGDRSRISCDRYGVKTCSRDPRTVKMWFRKLWIGLQLLPQPGNVHVDSSRGNIG